MAALEAVLPHSERIVVLRPYPGELHLTSSERKRTHWGESQALGTRKKERADEYKVDDRYFLWNSGRMDLAGVSGVRVGLGA